MVHETCTSGHASQYGPSLLDVCSATTFLAFISTLESSVDKNDAITGACERIRPVETPDDAYDFVVIGGGAGGSVVASRLSENPKYKVLLLEAGPDEPAGSGIPSFASEYLHTNIVWNYTTTNEPTACRSRNGSCPCPSGKNLGGNTAHNMMIYLRGNPTDYDNWAASGNEGWTWNEVEPFFKKSEDNGEIERVGRKHHGTGGPLSVERFPYVAPMGFSILEAAEELGYGISDDLNGDKFAGFSWTQSTNKKGVRSSAAKAFLRPARDRENLHVSLNSLVVRIIIENKRAVGVEYDKRNKLRRVCVKKEVIVSGGAMNSPQILLLSGIGPGQHLKSVGIPTVLDLPGVGRNFHDHPGIALTFTVDEPDTYDNDENVASRYVNDQTGPMSATGSISILGVLATDFTTTDYPDMQLYVVGYLANCAPGEVDAFRSDGKRKIIVLASHVHPRSRGTVTLASNNPFDRPILLANYQKDPRDLEAQIKGLKMGIALTKAKVLKSYNFTMVPLDACSRHEPASDDYLACVSHEDNYPLYHFAGSCKMGPSSDPMAVVDPQLRVHGIEGLRVADASIMPQVTSSNTQAPTMMIGERAADFIKKDWSKRRVVNCLSHKTQIRKCLAQFHQRC